MATAAVSWDVRAREQLKSLSAPAIRKLVSRVWAPAPEHITVLEKGGAAASGNAGADAEDGATATSGRNNTPLVRALHALPPDTDWRGKRTALVVYGYIGPDGATAGSTGYWLLGTTTSVAPLSVAAWQPIPVRQLSQFHAPGTAKRKQVPPPAVTLDPATAMDAVVDPRILSDPAVPAVVPPPMASVASIDDGQSGAAAAVTDTVTVTTSTTLPTKPKRVRKPKAEADTASVRGIDIAAGSDLIDLGSAEQHRRLVAAWDEWTSSGAALPGVYAFEKLPDQPPLLLSGGEAPARPIAPGTAAPSHSTWKMPRDGPSLHVQELWDLVMGGHAQRPWPTLQVAQMVWFALRPLEAATLGLLRWADTTGHTAWMAGRADTLLGAWKADPATEKANAALAGEIYVATQALRTLASCDSVLFQKARGLIVAATLADRVLRYRHVSAGAATLDLVQPLTCALTGEPIAPGAAYHAWDVQWLPRAGSAETHGSLMTVVVAEECHSWPLLPDIDNVVPAVAAADAANVANVAAVPVKEETPAPPEKKRSRKRKTPPPALANDATTTALPKKARTDPHAVVLPALFEATHPSLAARGLVLRGGRDVPAWNLASSCAANSTLTPALISAAETLLATCGTPAQLLAWQTAQDPSVDTGALYAIMVRLAEALWQPATTPTPSPTTNLMSLVDDDDDNGTAASVPFPSLPLDAKTSMMAVDLIQKTCAKVKAGRAPQVLELTEYAQRQPAHVAAAWRAMQPGIGIGM